MIITGISPLPWQVERFLRHIEAAKRLEKPLIIHARDAESEAVDILKSENAGETGFVLHCFSSTAEVAKKALDAGGMIGINGNMTFKRSVAIQDACAAIPMDRILAETDCPIWRLYRSADAGMNLPLSRIPSLK